MKNSNSNILVLCDKPIQISQTIGMIECNKDMSITNFGENLIVVIVDTLGNNSHAEIAIKDELSRVSLFNAKIIKYDYESPIYRGDYSTKNSIQNLIYYIKSKLGNNITHIICALLSQRFVKIHLDAYPAAPIYMIEDGLASYLNIPVKYLTELTEHYKVQGVALSHMKRVRKNNLLHHDLGIPKSQLDFRYLSVNFNSSCIEQTKKIENHYVFLNKKHLKVNRDLMLEFWKYKSIDIDFNNNIDALLIGQNFSDFCNEFYFRDEIELYLEICELLLIKFKKVLFVPHPKQSDNVINIMKERISEPSRIAFHDNPSIPVESLILAKNSPKYVFGFYSTAMWNIKNHLSFNNVYTVLGWSTLDLYKKLGHDIQKQAYRKARQNFFPLEKI